jgi:hypothetical protein
VAVRYNRNLGVFQVDGRGAYASQAEAEAADAATAAGEKVSNETYDEDVFAQSLTTKAPTTVKAPGPRATSPDGLTYLDTGEQTPLAIRRGQMARGELTGNVKQQAQNMDARLTFTPGDAGSQGDEQYDAERGLYYIGGQNGGPRFYISNDPAANAASAERPTFSIGGDGSGGLALSAGDPSQMPLGQRTGTAAEADAANTRYATTGTSALPGGAAGAGLGGVAPVSTTGQQLGSANQATETAEDRFNAEQEKNATENQNLFSGAMDRFNNLEGGDYLAADDARGYQQEGLQQQRMLLEKLFDFDENQYAAQFGDQTLSRMIAAGRQGTSAAEQQAGRFAALEQAPAVYAEGRRQASELANQRLGMAQTASKSFGELGTMTRGQDETRAQFEAQLPLEIAKSVSELTQGKMNLNQAESQMFGEMWMDFAQLQSIYAGMSSQEQMAWWQQETARRGQDKVLDGVIRTLKANGAVSDKDILNGLFQLGGGLIGLAGRSGAT